MKVFVLSKADLRRFYADKLVAKYGWDPTYIVHTQEQKRTLEDRGVSGEIVVNTTPDKIQAVSIQREFVAKELMPRGEWSLWLDDNVQMITCLPPKYSVDKIVAEGEMRREWRERFDTEATPAHVNHYLTETVKRAEELGTIYAGFATIDNYFFRLKKWQYPTGYVRTSFALYKNDGSTWFPFDTMMLEDLGKACDVVARYGGVLVNRHLRVHKTPFQVGGIGSFEDRLPHLQDNCRKLKAMYPGLVDFVKPSDQYGVYAKEYHLRFVLQTVNTVNKWRENNGYL